MNKRDKEEIIKHNYLIEHISKGEFKIKETIAISSICFDHRLKDLKPIFQKYVTKENGTDKYYYDLYFEKINLIVEINEEHHEDASEIEEDLIKMNWAIEKLKCEYEYIHYDEKYGNLHDQLETLKLKMLKLIEKIGVQNTRWVENSINPFEYIQTQKRTIMVRVSESYEFKDLRQFPLQLNRKLLELDGDITVIYLTGGTGTIATPYKVNKNEWQPSSTNLIHSGRLDTGNTIVTSGSTFYSESKNTLLSPDLNEYLKKY
jgi:hypothetical protein